MIVDLLVDTSDLYLDFTTALGNILIHFTAADTFT